MKSFKTLEKVKSNYKKLLLEFISAFLGVLIALLINNWKEEQKEQEFISKSIVSIYNDNKVNLNNINDQIVLIEQQTDTLFKYLNNKNLSILDIIRINQGFQIVELTDLSWKILQNSQLVNKIDYNLLTKLMSISQKINSINVSIDKITDIIYDLAESKNLNDKYRMYIIEKDLLHLSVDFKIKAEELNEIIVSKYGKKLNLTN